MPCDSGGGYDVQRQEFSVSQQRAHDATVVACELARRITTTQRKKLSKKALNWIKRHEAEDRKRLVRETQQRKDRIARRKALAKLTIDERRLLNINNDEDESE